MKGCHVEALPVGIRTVGECTAGHVLLMASRLGWLLSDGHLSIGDDEPPATGGGQGEGLQDCCRAKNKMSQIHLALAWLLLQEDGASLVPSPAKYRRANVYKHPLMWKQVLS